MISKRFTYGLIVVWPAMWINILQSMVGISTLGYWVPCWDVSWMYWAGKKFSLWGGNRGRAA